mmetsp:Transcript_23894/g.27516  ORF Transcript_23894/g.27516 Transcript_23894/m.27516 type:complete len:98 (+) Transcript_23894:513-806(+)
MKSEKRSAMSHKLLQRPRWIHNWSFKKRQGCHRPVLIRLELRMCLCQFQCLFLLHKQLLKFMLQSQSTFLCLYQRQPKFMRRLTSRPQLQTNRSKNE